MYTDGHRHGRYLGCVRTVHNLRATWRPQGQGWLDESEVRFGVENVMDADYVGHLSSPGRKAPGRTVKMPLAQSF